jgi:hypothetical protein
MIDSRFAGVLSILHHKLPVDKVNWAITGSVGLVLLGIEVNIQDVDIQTDKEGAYEMERRLSDLSVRRVEFKTAEKIRSYFGELNINGIKTEILGDIQNKNAGGGWTRVANVLKNRQFIEFIGMQLPVTTLKCQYQAYKSMGRLEKAEKIKKFLESNTLSKDRAD